MYVQVESSSRYVVMPLVKCGLLKSGRGVAMISTIRILGPPYDARAVPSSSLWACAAFAIGIGQGIITPYGINQRIVT